MKNNLILVGVIAAVVGLGIGFASGMKYQQSRQPQFNRQFGGNFGGPNGQRGGNFQGNRQGFRPVTGEIISADSSSITIKAQDGSSRIVLFNDKTTINQAASASAQDLKTGERVAAFGQTNSDGSVTANNIQINPTLNRQMMPGQPN